MAWVQTISVFLLIAAYLRGIHAWAYERKARLGILAVVLVFPLTLHLAYIRYPEGHLFMALPLAGIGFFFDRYRSRTCRLAAPALFNALSIGALFAHYAFVCFGPGLR